jgi:transposase
MARKRTRMQKIRDIIRVRADTNLSERQISRALRVSRSVVSRTLAQFRGSGLSREAAEAMSDSELEQALWRKDRVAANPRYAALADRFAVMTLALKQKGMTLERLWQQYVAEDPGGYQYSQFCLHFQRWAAGGELAMHMEHKAGEQMYADWAGEPLEVVNGSTGQQWAVEVYVGILGASGLTWVQASESRDQECWIRVNEGALRYFGGSSEALIPDNLKTGVTKSDRYEPETNLVFEEFARHYSMVVFPARVRRARDKALVENAVRLVYQRIYCPLRGHSFRSLDEVNQAIRDLVEEHNNRPLQRLGISRRQLFERTERQALRPLPHERFALKSIQMARVQVNYHVELRQDRHYYSVPFYLRTREPKTEVKVVYDERTVAIYYQNVRVAQHRRDRTPNGYSTLAEHMPDSHRHLTEWNPERFLSWAREIDSDVEEVIKRVLASRTYAPQAYRVCLGILSLHKRYGSLRLGQACRVALRYDSHSYSRIRNILAQGLEQENQPELELTETVPPVHENLRGAEYFN